MIDYNEFDFTIDTYNTYMDGIQNPYLYCLLYKYWRNVIPINHTNLLNG